MNTVYFDIETAPLPETDIHHLAPKFEAPANYKDPVKIADHIAAQKVEWMARGALSPLTGTVAAIGMLSRNNQPRLTSDGAALIMLAGDPGRSESIIIAEFWEFIRDHYERTRFIGFNIFRFDLPFLIRRSWKLKIPVPLGVRDGRYFNDSFFDLMELWQLNNREERVSLDTLCKYLGVGAKSGEGADFHKMPPEIQRTYLFNDLTLTRNCAERLMEMAPADVARL